MSPLQELCREFGVQLLSEDGNFAAFEVDEKLILSIELRGEEQEVAISCPVGRWDKSQTQLYQIATGNFFGLMTHGANLGVDPADGVILLSKVEATGSPKHFAESCSRFIDTAEFWMARLSDTPVDAPDDIPQYPSDYA